jgi:predicted RNA methylase
MLMTASYDPADDKIRLRASARLDAETYARVKAAGFGWAPKQGLFYAVWRPDREDLMLELCGEIGDEDTSLVDRAEERAERFEEYSDKRGDEAERARANVERIAGGIPLGQHVLVGHHSEKHARRDAKRIEDGMRKSIKLWETSTYWTRRAQGAIDAAKYKELPSVRHRRIKGLESDKRKMLKDRERSMTFIKLWSKPDLTRDAALKICNYQHGVSVWSDIDQDKITPAQAAERCIKSHTRTAEHCERWLAHLENRLAYERAMLGESGGLAADRFDIKVGGRVFLRGRRAGEWFVVKRLNKGAEGRVNSVTVFGIGWTVGIESVADYRDPEEGDVAKVKKATSLAPIVNYPGGGFLHMTKADWDSGRKHSGSYYYSKQKAGEKYGAHRVALCYRGGSPKYVYLTDVATKMPPPAVSDAEPVRFEREVVVPDAPPPAPKPAPEPTAFDAMRESLKGGVQVVVNPDLFQTPPELAQRVVDALGDVAGVQLLEPSAGTGALADALRARGAIVHVESSEACAEVLRQKGHDVEARDFLTSEGRESYGAVVLNPPFSNNRDIEHVLHAYTHLAHGGRLVAIVSAGVRFRNDRETDRLRALIHECGSIEDLPEGSFKSAGTSVRTCLVVLNKPYVSLHQQQGRQSLFA